jgi:hypothetical protein
MALKLVEHCQHDISDQDVAIQCEGLCPLCLLDDLERLRSGFDSLVRAMRQIASTSCDPIAVDCAQDAILGLVVVHWGKR